MIITADPKVETFVASKPNLPKYLEPSVISRIATVALAVLTAGLSVLVLASIEYLARRAFMMAAYIPEPEKKELYNQRDLFINDNKSQAKEITFETYEKIKLNGIFVTPENKEVIQDKSQEKCIIFFCGMGCLYEHYVADNIPKKYADHTGANVLFFNYRGIGKSEGTPHYGQHAVIDGDAAIQYLVNQGYKRENIVLHGHSLGGGISSQVALIKKNESCMNLNEKSFKSSGDATGAHKGAFLATLVFCANWNLPAYKLWEKESPKANKAIIVHKKDALIPYKVCSLYKYLTGMGYTKEKKEAYAENILVRELYHPKNGKTKVYFDTYDVESEEKSSITTHTTLLLQGDKAIQKLSCIVGELFASR